MHSDIKTINEAYQKVFCEEHNADLLPCPFCGSTNIKIFQPNSDPWHRRQCVDCSAIGPPGKGMPGHGDSGGIEAWNERVKL